MKLMRTIRLDPSDAFVFAQAAEPGEWAVSGAFAFWSTDIAGLHGKARAAFRGGFLGIDTLGWSTLVQVVEARAGERQSAVELLAQRLAGHFGAPDIASATRAAEEEIAFAASLCEHAPGTLIAVHRRVEDGEIREQFRTLRRREGERPLRAFALLDVEGEEEPAERVDLAGLMGERK